MIKSLYLNSSEMKTIDGHPNHLKIRQASVYTVDAGLDKRDLRVVVIPGTYLNQHSPHRRFTPHVMPMRCTIYCPCCLDSLCFTIHSRINVLLIFVLRNVSASSASKLASVCEMTSITKVFNGPKPFSFRIFWTVGFTDLQDARAIRGGGGEENKSVPVNSGR